MHNQDLLDKWVYNFHQGANPKSFLKKGSWFHLTNERASRKELKSLGGFPFTTFRMPVFIAMPERLRLP
jgi:hypothetical protein